MDPPKASKEQTNAAHQQRTLRSHSRSQPRMQIAGVTSGEATSRDIEIHEEHAVPPKQTPSILPPFGSATRFRSSSPSKRATSTTDAGVLESANLLVTNPTMEQKFEQPHPLQLPELLSEHSNSSACNDHTSHPPTSGSPTKSSSPRKKPASKANSEILRAAQLIHLNPPIIFETYARAKAKGILTEKVRYLWRDFVAPAVTSQGFIPEGLKDRMTAALDTPEKSKPVPPAQAYETRIKYKREDLELIWSTTEDVFSMANEYRRRTHEPHWAEVVISPILHLIRRLQHFKGPNTEYRSTLEAVNISTAEISPSFLCPYADNPDIYKGLDKKVDYCMGIMLDDEDRETLQRGVFAEGGGEPSLNQSSNFVNFTPIYLNLEVKRRDVAKDPLVQLAAWIAAEFNKRRLESYPVDMPVLAIAVTGDLWELYVVSQPRADNESLHFLGPTMIGATTTREGIFRIVEVLTSLGDWANECYRPWFMNNILRLYEKGS